MDFVSIRVITGDVERMARFYEQATGRPVTRRTEDFAELVTPSATMAIASTRTIQMFGAGAAHQADNHSVIVEFRVEDVDAEYEKLKGLGCDMVLEPTTQPWGNRSLLFRDPDGNLVNFFTPASPAGRLS